MAFGSARVSMSWIGWIYMAAAVSLNLHAISAIVLSWGKPSPVRRRGRYRSRHARRAARAPDFRGRQLRRRLCPRIGAPGHRDALARVESASRPSADHARPSVEGSTRRP